jgi:translation initiation factor IF-3
MRIPEKKNRINDEIKARNVRLIAPDGEQVGIIPLDDALGRARTAGLDLVEVSAESDPPVCRILDYGKFRYGSKRKEHGPKPKTKKQHFGQIKEIRMRPKIDKHDLERKLGKARELLEEGYRLQVTCLFRGREMTHLELGYSLLNRAAELLADCSKLERRLNREGRRMNIMLMPKIEVVRTKTKEREEQARKHAEEVAKHKKKSKARRESVRRKAVRVDGGEELTNEIEVPVEAAEKVEKVAEAPQEPEKVEGEDAQAKDTQGTEKED